jgi:putative transposase
MAKDLVINALEKAIKRRNPDPGLICHSDRGSQYCSHAYQDLLKKQAVGAQVDRTDYCCLSADVVCPGHG